MNVTLLNFLHPYALKKHAVEKQIATINDMGRTIEIYGFRPEVTVDEVKEFLENHTGDGTVSTVRISKPKDDKTRFTSVTVRFKSKLAAEYIVAKATTEEKKLWFESSYLKAREVEKKATSGGPEMERMEDVKGQLGSMISKDKMRVIWEGEKWNVEFGNGVRKLWFYLSYEVDDYKMELCFENILSVEFRCPLNQPSKFFLIQVSSFFLSFFSFFLSFLSLLKLQCRK